MLGGPSGPEWGQEDTSSTERSVTDPAPQCNALWYLENPPVIMNGPVLADGVFLWFEGKSIQPGHSLHLGTLGLTERSTVHLAALHPPPGKGPP